jgi:hypothetical protein
MFLNINNFILKDPYIKEDIETESGVVDKDEEYKLLNSDYLILNYMRINVLNEGKYII